MENVSRKFLIIKGTSDGYVIPVQVDGYHDLIQWASLFRQDIFNKVDAFATESRLGDAMKLDNIYIIINWTGKWEEVKK